VLVVIGMGLELSGDEFLVLLKKSSDHRLSCFPRLNR
jgi:hypothetical protein